MKGPLQLINAMAPVEKSHASSRLGRGFLLLLLGLGCAVLPTVRAVDPPPDGGYPNGNTAEGEDALFSLIDTGLYNTAIGFHALYSTISGNFNTATGNNALFSLTIGDEDTATGFSALYSNTTGTGNTAMGHNALHDNTTGDSNTAIGLAALSKNLKGRENTASGVQTLYLNTNGTRNVANGLNALYNNTTGSDNIALGAFAGSSLTTGSHNIDIGNQGLVDESRTIRIGTVQTHRATFIAGVNGVTVPGGVGVIVDGNGQLGTVTSSERFKEQIKPMDSASEAILALQPVTFRYKQKLDPNSIPQFGLVAEQVEKVNPDLVARDDQGKPYTVRYEAVNAMLLNEFLKEHRKVEEQMRVNQEQDATIAALRSTLAQQQKAIAALTSQIRKVSKEIKAGKATLQVASVNP